jgi:peptide/nickel transport system permease protein
VSASFARYVLRRVIAGLALVVVVTLGAFLLGHLVPGDATTDLWTSGAGPAAVAAERARLGLDQPLFGQVSGWAGGLARLDLGVSSQYRQPVGGLVRERAAMSARLAAIALTLATVIGLPLGFLTGARPRAVWSKLIGGASIAIVSCHPLIGALALTLVALRTGWFSGAPGNLIVPALALALPFAAMLERLQSRATAETIAAPDVLAAAARGIPSARLLWVHVGRQSLRPVLGIYGIVIGSLFGGALGVEFVTAYPGLGRLLYDALVARDLYLVAGCAFAGSIMLATGNLVADLARAILDPRVRA